MIDFIKTLLKKYRELIVYVIVGAATTFVYFAVYAVCRHLGVHYEINTCISWFAAVLFAFFSNKYIVFQAKEGSRIFREMLSFFAMRFVTLGVDLLLTYLFFDVMEMNEWAAKILDQTAILVLNYLFSKFLIFAKK